MGNCVSKRGAAGGAVERHHASNTPAPATDTSGPAPTGAKEEAPAEPAPAAEAQAGAAPGGQEDAGGKVSHGARAWQAANSKVRIKLGHTTDSLAKMAEGMVRDHLRKSTAAPVQRREEVPRTRNVRVFVSSCFVDMGEERHHLMTNAFPVLQSVCQSKAISLIPCDMRWGVKAESETSEVVSICLNEVVRCSPYMIVLLGDRYGWVPKREDLEAAQALVDSDIALEANTGKSITHLELQTGLFSLPEANRRALVFIRESSYVDTLPAEQREGFRDSSAEAQAGLASLKEALKKSGVRVTPYSDPTDLPGLVTQQLLDAILQDFPDAGVFSDPMEREWFQHMAFADSRAKLFAPFQKLVALVQAEIKGEESQPVLFYGSSGSGKSSLMAYLVEQLLATGDEGSPEARQENLVHAHFIGHSAHSAHFGHLARRLLHQLKEWAGTSEPIPATPDKIIAAIPSFMELAAAAHPGKKMFIVLDALNQLQDIEGAKSLQWLPQKTPANVHLVLTCIPEDECFETLKERAAWRHVCIPAVGIQERRELASLYLTHLAKQLEADRFEKIIQAEQCSSPLYLRLLLDELSVVGTFDHLDEQIDAMLEAGSVAALYSKVLERFEGTYDRDDLVADGFGLVQRVLGFIQLSRHGLDETEMLAALQLPRARVAAFFHAINSSLVAQSGLLLFSHQAISLAVERRYVSTEATRRALHAQLAAYFATLDAASPRLYEELPWHLLQGGDLAALKEFCARLSTFEHMSESPFARMELAGYWRSIGLEQAGPAYRRAILERAQPPAADGHGSGTSDAPAEAASREEVARLIFNVATALHEWAAYGDAERYYGWALGCVLNSTRPVAELYGSKAAKKPPASVPDDVAGRPEAEQLLVAGILERWARLQTHKSQASAARDLLAHAIAIRQRLNGQDSLEVCRLLDDLGWIQIISRNVQGEDGALAVLKHAIRSKVRLVGVPHGADLDAQGDGLGDAALRTILQAAVEHCAPGSPMAAALRDAALHISVNRLAVAVSNLQDLGLASCLYKASLTLHENLLGVNHPSVATVCGDIGNLLARQMKILLAEEAAAAGAGGDAPAAAEDDLGDVYEYKAAGGAEQRAAQAAEIRADGETIDSLFERAKKIFARALRIRANAVGENHPFYASSLMHFGDLLLAKGQEEEAVDLYRRVVDIRTKSLGPSNKQTRAAVKRLERFSRPADKTAS